MKRRKIAWMVGIKVVLTLAMTLRLNSHGPVEYWALAPLPGLKAGAPVVVYGQVIGQVTAKEGRGDTTVLKVRFNRDARRLPASRVVQLRRMGLGDAVFLEMHPGGRRDNDAFTRGGWLRVLPAEPFPYLMPGDVIARMPRQAPPPWLWQLIPPGPPASRMFPLRST
jgi:hypothetical protein